jgi:ABC-type glycerol-3-phosphate transport system substrate-binding protein
MITPITDIVLVRKLELETTPINNFRIFDDVFDSYMSVISWYHNRNDIDANSSIYKKWNKISELLGFKPIYHPTYLYKNGLWAFYWNGDSVLLYYDKRGMKIQVGLKFKKNEVVPLLEYIKGILNKKSII